MNTEKAIKMIDEYLLEPNSLSKDWVEVLQMCKQALMEKKPKQCKLFKDVCDCGHTVFPHMDFCDKCGRALVWGKDEK